MKTGASVVLEPTNPAFLEGNYPPATFASGRSELNPQTAFRTEVTRCFAWLRAHKSIIRGFGLGHESIKEGKKRQKEVCTEWKQTMVAISWPTPIYIDSILRSLPMLVKRNGQSRSQY